MFYLVAVTRFTGHIYTFICISYFGSIHFSIILFLVMSFLCHIKLAFFFMQICSGSDLANTWVRYFFVDICLYLCLHGVLAKLKLSLFENKFILIEGLLKNVAENTCCCWQASLKRKAVNAFCYETVSSFKLILIT